MRLAVALLLACACERDAPHEPPAPEPPPPVPPSPAYTFLYTAKTAAASDGTNPTYFKVVEDAHLFVVTEGPLSPDGSKIAAEAMEPYPPAECPPSGAEAQLQCAIDRATAKLVAAGAENTSIAAVHVTDDQAYVAITGEVGVLWMHGTAVDRLAAAPRVRRITVEATDTLVLVDRGLLDAVGPYAFRDALPPGRHELADLGAALKTVVERGEAMPRHRALSAIAVHVVTPAAGAGSRRTPRRGRRASPSRRGSARRGPSAAPSRRA